MVVDCLTLWLSNLMGADADCEAAFDALAAALKGRRTATRFVVVANEVGLGIVPATEMGRAFRDYAGRLNQRVAALADEAYLVVAGIALPLKPGAR